jgi:hypothetical protein
MDELTTTNQSFQSALSQTITTTTPTLQMATIRIFEIGELKVSISKSNIIEN